MIDRARILDIMPLQWGLVTGIGLAIILASTISANAKIRCNGQFQVVRGAGEISTPWCQDDYLTNIARTYGWKVSFRSVRQNPNLKERICRHIGHDHRLVSICSNFRSDNERTPRWR